MATSGTVNGTNVLVFKDGSTIAGQGSMTVTWGGTPIDISNKSSGDFRELMDGEQANKSLDISGDFVYNSDAQFRSMRADVIAGTSAAYIITFTSEATTDEAFSCQMIPTGMSDQVDRGDKISTTLTLMSTGDVTHTEAVT